MNNKIKCMKKAGKVTSKIMKEIENKFPEFETEKEIKDYIKKRLKQEGCKHAFKPIVVSGKESSNPHYFKNRKIKPGFCVVDFGAQYKGWKADMTRTFFARKKNKKMTKKEKEIYKKVLKTYKKCVKKAKLGGKISEVSEIYKKMLGKKRKHALGHGLGWRIHQKPRFGTKSKAMFEAEKPFTIEPGFYDDKIGGVRIEDSFYFTKKGKLIQITEGNFLKL